MNILLRNIEFLLFYYVKKYLTPLIRSWNSRYYVPISIAGILEDQTPIYNVFSQIYFRFFNRMRVCLFVRLYIFNFGHSGLVLCCVVLCCMFCFCVHPICIFKSLLNISQTTSMAKICVGSDNFDNAG